jgi:outer membrane receptor for ferrienterochelin and colicins
MSDFSNGKDFMRSLGRSSLFPFLFSIFLFSHPIIETFAQEEKGISDLLNLTLEELMNPEITTASQLKEKVSDAPGTVIVITKDDILSRGYSELSEIFNDLPGMDIVRVNGDISFKNYWRGFRNSFGADYLLLLDGLPWSDLYYNDAEVIRAFPISNIEKIEIVYGPVSSIYGANAFNGVINVKTVNKKDIDGSYFSGQISGGSQETAIGDMHFFYQKENMRLSLAVRAENGDAFPENSEEYEWAKSKYINDRQLWGGFVDSPGSAGLKSLNRHRAVDLRGYFNDIEIGLQFYQLTSGYSVQYAVDKVLPNVIWTKEDYSAYVRHILDLSDVLKSTTVFRYNASDIPNNAALAQGYNQVDVNGDTSRFINFELWQSLNSSVVLTQDFHYKFTEKLQIRTGFEYEQKNLQKAYEISPGPFLIPDSVDAGIYPFPEPPSPTHKYQNRIITDDVSGYSSLKYSITDRDIVNLGLRLDQNSQYGDAVTIRSGYIRKQGDFIFKLLYGEAFQEPSPRVLYGAWGGLGSDPDLKPERSNTIEFSTNHKAERINQKVSFYLIKNSDTILNLEQGGRNVGERDIYGFDYHFIHKPEGRILKGITVWGYYSYIHTEGDEVYDAANDRYLKGEIGDIAPHKFNFGITYQPVRKLSYALSGRYVSERNTVDSNPIKKVPSHTLFDLNVRVIDVLSDGLTLSFKVSNIFDETYFHPGIRTADAGETPGSFNNNSVWHGSEGWLNSLLPQPGRSIFLRLEFDF